MALRKLYKTGNSIVVSIPEELLSWIGAKEGDMVKIGNYISQYPNPVPKLRIEKVVVHETEPT